MPKSSKPRKKYQPHRRTAFADAVGAQALRLRQASRRQLDAAQVRDLQLLAHSALESVEKGDATEQDVLYLAFASNVCMLLCEKGLGPEYLDEVKSAQGHLLQLLAMVNRKEPIVLSDAGRISVRRLLELHDAQVALAEYTEGLAYTVVAEILRRMENNDVLEVPE